MYKDGIDLSTIHGLPIEPHLLFGELPWHTATRSLTTTKPRNVGSFEKGDESVGTGMVGAPACGDVMKLQIKVNPDRRD